MSDEIRGFAFPFRIENGRVASSSGAEKLRDNILHIIVTNPGERVMRRAYGAGVRQIVHDPNNDALRAIAQHQITKAVTQAEPRVEVQAVRIDQSEEPATLIAELAYTIRRTRQPQALSVPIGLGGL
jgi:Bacteriophage baseplate protein W